MSEEEFSEASKGKYTLAWVLVGILSSIGAQILDLIISPILMPFDNFNTDNFESSIYWVVAPILGMFVWLTIAISVYSLFNNIIISKVVPWIWGLGGLGLLASLWQIHQMFNLLEMNVPSIFQIASVVAFVGSVYGFTWYFKTKKPERYYDTTQPVYDEDTK